MGFKTVDEYIASFPPDVRAILRDVRKTIRSAAPGVEEKIAYQMAGYKLNGKPIVYFAGWKDHVGIYGVSSALDAFKAELKPYAGAVGSLRFALAKPLPLTLISDVVKYQARENRDKAGQKKRASRR